MNHEEESAKETCGKEYVVFEGHKRIARGGMLETALAVYRAYKNKESGPVVALDATTCELAEPDLRGGEDGIRARYADVSTSAATPKPQRGRPKLGVTAREVTLLPRHWEWLENNPAGASAKLRTLVETAMRASIDKDRKQRAVAVVERFTNALAGDLPGAEEVSRAFYAGRINDVITLTAGWPKDVRDYYRELVRRAI
jgi:uncharacterized protein